MTYLCSVALILLSTLFTWPLLSQNLIPNGSFEQCKKLDNKWTFSRPDFENSIYYWSSPIDGSPDILFNKVLGNMMPIRPNVNVAAHSPYSGRIMMGLKTYGCGYSDQHCKEYLQVGLNSPLLPGERYTFSVRGQLLKDGIRTSSLGVVILKDSLHLEFASNLYGLTSVICTMEGDDPSGWQKMIAEIVPQDTAHYLLFGNFLPDSLVARTGNNNPPVPYTYWLLDDMELVKQYAPGEKLLTIKDVGFDFNESNLSPEGQAAVTRMAQEMIANGITAPLRIEGHTDDVGTDDYNQALSLARSQSVADLLEQLGVENTFSVIGYGEVRPMVDNDTEENRRRNRRVAVFLEE